MLTEEQFEHDAPAGKHGQKTLRDHNIAEKLKSQAHKIAISRPDFPPPQIRPSDYRQHIIELQAFKNLLVILGFAFVSCLSHAKRQVMKKIHT